MAEEACVICKGHRGKLRRYNHVGPGQSLVCDGCAPEHDPDDGPIGG